MKKIKILNVLGSMGVGGAEKWCFEVLKYIDKARFEIDFLVNKKFGKFSKEIEDLKHNIFVCSKNKGFFTYVNNFKNILNEQNYNIIHCHLQYFNGILTKIAYSVGIPGRICHIRNTKDGKPDTIIRMIYRLMMKAWITKYSTHLLAVSAAAAKNVYGEDLIKKGKVQILTGIDFSNFNKAIDRKEERKKLGLENDKIAICHIGSFRPQKNHIFIIEVAESLIKLTKNFKIFFIGDGSLLPYIKMGIEKKSISNYFCFLGERDDIANLLTAMDLFIFPSLYEGMPRALIEAQVTGLPCVVSDTITKECFAKNSLIKSLSLRNNQEEWAKTIIELSNYKDFKERGKYALEEFYEKGFNIESNAKRIMEIYESIAKH